MIISKQIKTQEKKEVNNKEKKITWKTCALEIRNKLKLVALQNCASDPLFIKPALAKLSIIISAITLQHLFSHALHTANTGVDKQRLINVDAY